MSVFTPLNAQSVPLFAPSQTIGQTLAFPNQQLQYFAQGQSNSPGQTVDLILRNLTGLASLALNVTQSPTYLAAITGGDIPPDDVWRKTIDILNKVIDGIITKFAENPIWFSAILPFKGYASNSAINSVFSQPNVISVNQYSEPTSAVALARVFYTRLYAQTKDFQHETEQINRYSYKFIAIALTEAIDYLGATVSKTTTEWLATILNEFDSSNGFNPGSAFKSSKGGFWSNSGSSILLKGFLDLFDTNSVYIEAIVPTLFKVQPNPTSPAITVDVSQGNFYIFVYLLLAVLLSKQLKALNIGLLKISQLYDSVSNTYLFSDTSIAVNDALTAFSIVFEPFYRLSTLKNIGAATHPGPFIDYNSLTVVETIGALDARNASADPNRIPGSLRPTILFQRDIVRALQTLFTQTIFQDVITSPNQNLAFVNAITAFNAALPAVDASLTAAFGSLESQKDIHYGRFPFNLGNI